MGEVVVGRVLDVARLKLDGHQCALCSVAVDRLGMRHGRRIDVSSEVMKKKGTLIENERLDETRNIDCRYMSK